MQISALLAIFANSIVPILLIAGIGFVLARYLQADVKTLSSLLPMMILLMGMQIQRTAVPERPSVVGVATIIRMVVVPALAIGIAALMHLTGPDRQAAVIQAAMPAAVMITVLAVEFQTAPAFVTGVVFLSTLISPLTLTLLIAWLQ